MESAPIRRSLALPIANPVNEWRDMMQSDANNGPDVVAAAAY
jgi:hypothetical protein